MPIRIAAAVGLTALAFACAGKQSADAPRVSGALQHRAYVWQRDWNAAVRAAVMEHSREFAGLAVLGAQIENAKVVRPGIDWNSLAAARAEVAAVIRVERDGDGSTSPPAERVLTEARRLIAVAASHGIELAEIQIDYDSPQKKLSLYSAWLRGVERALDPLPVRMTTLASWLGEPEFPGLLAVCDGYILQVHSFDPPAQGKKPAVCDPINAAAWVEQAAKLGKPFAVALPTYRTTAGYDLSGKLIGVATDSVAPEWPPATVRHEFPSDAIELAGLVAGWMKNRPRELTGIYWYRLPVATDVRNWRWPALAAVMAGRSPVSQLEVKLSGAQPLDVVISNSGELDEWLPQSVSVTWTGPAPAAGDGVAGWKVSTRAGRAVFSSNHQPAGRYTPPDPPAGDPDAKPSDKPVPVFIPTSKSEQKRLAATARHFDKAMRTRTVAASHLLKAADLLADGTEDKAKVLNTAGYWLQDIDNPAADRIYHRIEKSLAATPTGKAILERHWFTGTTNPWEEVEPEKAGDANDPP